MSDAKNFTKKELDAVVLKDKFYEQDAEKIKREFNLSFSLDEILNGLNVELEHKDITGGDLTETAKIVIAHLEELPDYYTRLKAMEEKGKKETKHVRDVYPIREDKTAVIMRDGLYYYLAHEIGATDLKPLDLVKVYRPASEVKKAHDRFLELKHLPVVAEHPNDFLDLKNESSYEGGRGTNPQLKTEDGMTIDVCSLNLQGKTKAYYDSGVREISCGWEGDYEKVNHPDYQYIQRFVDFNHIALVKKGRCGDICSIKDQHMELTDSIVEIISKGEVNMGKEELKSLIEDALKKVMTKDSDDTDRDKDKEKETEDGDESAESEESKKIKELEAKIKELEAIQNKEEKDDKVKDKKKAKDEGEEADKEKGKEDKEDEDDVIVVDDDEDEVSLKEGDDDKAVRDKHAKLMDKFKKLKDCYAKMKDASKKKTQDSMITHDQMIEDAKEVIKKEFIRRVADVLPAVEMGIIKAKDCIGKTPCQIKQEFVKRVLDKDIELTDLTTLNSYFDIALKSYEHDAWKPTQKMRDSLVSDALTLEIEQINSQYSLGGK